MLGETQLEYRGHGTGYGTTRRKAVGAGFLLILNEKKTDV
jgi:hypothetical protein